MQKSLPKLKDEDKKNKIIICFDIESAQVETEHGKFMHEPNLLCAIAVCDLCYNADSHTRKPFCQLHGNTSWSHTGKDCVKIFGDLIYQDIAAKAEKAKCKVFVFAHNFQRYDGQFIYRDLFDRRFIDISPVMNGLKICKLDVGNVRFIDSLNLFQQRLSALPKSFGFESMAKGDFPHKFNVHENRSYIGQWPAKEFFDYDTKTEKEKAEFDEWYATVVDKEFNFQDELLKYCTMDVEILINAIQRFRSLFQAQTEMDPITRNFTLASIGLDTYRALFLKDNQTIGRTPIKGYTKRLGSVECNIWLEWMEKTLNITIDREVSCGPFFADGFHGNLRFEYNGCFYHGCPKCFPDNRDRINGLLKRSMNSLYQETERKRAYYIRQGNIIVEFWGCQLKQSLISNPDFKKFYDEKIEMYDNLKLNRVELRTALCGGRTNNLKFHKEAFGDERIRYHDVTSEYPYVLKYFRYPVGHPTVINSDFKSVHRYFGFVCCTILAPRQLYIPVLPLKVNNKLLFPLCFMCALEGNQLSCNHSNDERQMTSTWCTAELQKAVKLGYQIKKIHQVYHYEQSSDKLFSGYIDLWLKLKYQASGLSEKQITDPNWFRKFQEKEGIILTKEEIKKNPGLRYISKLMLNSLWGKLAQRPNLPQTSVCTERHEYWDLVRRQEEGEITISGHKLVSDETIIVSWTLTKEEDCNPGNTNVAIASFVTAYARLHLFKYMEKILEFGRDRLLYFDTDSIIYVEMEGEKILECGEYLGELTDELNDYGPGAYIKEFVSGGPKNYAYCVQTLGGENFTTIKTKGIKMNGAVLNTLTLKLMVDFVKAYTDIADKKQLSINVPQLRFGVEKDTHKVFTADIFKIYRVVSEKRRVLGNNTLPYGYIDE